MSMAVSDIRVLRPGYTSSRLVLGCAIRMVRQRAVTTIFVGEG